MAGADRTPMPALEYETPVPRRGAGVPRGRVLIGVGVVMAFVAVMFLARSGQRVWKL